MLSHNKEEIRRSKTSETKMKIEKYIKQQAEWPKKGKYVMAQSDEDSVIVYQAYRDEIANYAVNHQQFGGAFKYDRMSWIKPNFLWMMYRSGWGIKEGQENVLAVRIKRSFFDELTEVAVASSYGASSSEDHDTWKAVLASSDVRLQWDPDHSPTGEKEERKAIQLGLRGEMLERYGKECVLSIENISDFVAEQREYVKGDFSDLMTPSEKSYDLTELGKENIGGDENE